MDVGCLSRFCRGVPESKLAIHDLGNRKAPSEAFPVRVNLISLEREHLSAEALESCRIAANKYMVKTLGKENFHMRICPQPLNILRINKMLTCAGADRLQTDVVREALRRARNKLPGKQLIQNSQKHGFTGLFRDEYDELKANKRLLSRGLVSYENHIPNDC
ncbi:unnamed protein product [Medioppia subpectinata]|uniref:Uncharacterized protein n=1 Tax=Medioppia subpectinata TaxID=1979941 RepID=A0A7R9KFU9_9ACAR|nr:unnamed protein product [Medioppia subpectinata]CAG2101417.1 unnamed protein product [Medioppia subpectinata]